MRISDWSSDVCSSDLGQIVVRQEHAGVDYAVAYAQCQIARRLQRAAIGQRQACDGSIFAAVEPEDEGTRVSNRACTGECCAVAALNLSSRVVGEGRGGERQCRPGPDRALVGESAGARVDGKRTTGLQARRPDDRRGGREGVSKWRSRRSPYS